MKIFSDFLPSILDGAWFIISFILCLLSWIDGDENDDDSVHRGAVGVAEDMLEVSLIINVHFSLLCCNLIQLLFVLTLFGGHLVDDFLASVGCCPKKILLWKVMWFTAVVTNCSLSLSVISCQCWSCLLWPAISISVGLILFVQYMGLHVNLHLQ